MDPADKELLEKSLKLSEENNRILKEMERNAKWGRIFSVIRIVIFVLPFVIGFLYLLPFIRKINDFYSVFGAERGTSTSAISDFWTDIKGGL